MANVTYYVALPFIRADDGPLVAGEAQEKPNANAAVRAAANMAQKDPGAVAFSRTGDPYIGDFEDAVVIQTFAKFRTSTTCYVDRPQRKHEEMGSAVHLINRPNAHGDLERLTRVDDGTFRTCCWALTQEDAAKLQGGWIYLHERKSDPSRFGGRVLAVERIISDEFARETRFAFVFAPHLQGKMAIWRGQSHGMAWSSGLVDADLEHEVG